MAGDFARWAATETAAALTHDTPRPADPFACIPNSDQEYEGTPLEFRTPDTATEECE